MIPKRPGIRFAAPATLLTLALAAGGCATAWNPPESQYCRTDEVLLDAHFEGGHLGECRVEGDGFVLTQYPENRPPINHSPWYAFRASGEPGDTVRVRMVYTEAWARYWPKVSTDGETWTRLPDTAVSRNADGDTMTIEFTLDRAWTYVAGGELLTGDWYADWLRELDAEDGVDVQRIGRSVNGRPLFLAATAPRDEVVLLIGRQHPPEVTGALTMRPFVDTIFAGTPTSRAFLERFQVVMVPLVNPDGVARGHWRHNVGGVDLNRDWGPFSQPETTAIKRWLDAHLDEGHELRLMFDFHSTRKNVFYTQRDGLHPTQPRDFTAKWLAAGSARLPDYPFTREATENLDQANSKNWFYKTYGIPAITYETGDETDRAEMAHAARVFAEEMMRLLLETP